MMKALPIFMHTFRKIIDFIRETYREERKEIPLHSPVFGGNTKKYLLDCIDSTFVSSIGSYVDEFERKICEFTGARHAVATVNGTAALHIALILAGVKRDDEVITQAISFVATTNAIRYCGAWPVFLDSDCSTMGLSPEALEAFLQTECRQEKDACIYDKTTGRRISACVPMHVCGHPVRIERIRELCRRFGIALVEDAAESLGSFFNARHTGTFGRLGIFSFNGNKTITTGGGGMLLTDDEALAKRARHMTTTAKVSHPWRYYHDETGYNYRMPNINAALGCAQMEMLPGFIESKRKLAAAYRDFFESIEVDFIAEPEGGRSNYWLNAIRLDNSAERDAFLAYSHERGVLSRSLWTLLSELPMYSGCRRDELINAGWLSERVVNIPSGVIPGGVVQ